MKDLDKYTDLRELVKDCGGIEQLRLWAKPNKKCYFCMAELSDDWVECVLVDDSYDLYSLKTGYKIRMLPLDDNYASSLFYQSDLLSLIKQGFVLIKQPNDYISHNKGIEYITPFAFLVHEWDEIKK